MRPPSQAKSEKSCWLFRYWDWEAPGCSFQLLGNSQQRMIGGSREGERCPAKGDSGFLSPSRAHHTWLSTWLTGFTYNAATGSIIKEGVLVLDVVPGDTKKAGQFISLSLFWDYCHPRPRANL